MTRVESFAKNNLAPGDEVWGERKDRTTYRGRVVEVRDADLLLSSGPVKYAEMETILKGFE